MSLDKLYRLHKMIKSTSCPELTSQSSNKKHTFIRGLSPVPSPVTTPIPTSPCTPCETPEARRSSMQLSAISAIAPHQYHDIDIMTMSSIEFYSMTRATFPSVISCQAPRPSDTLQDDLDIVSCLETPTEGPEPQCTTITTNNNQRWTEWVRRLRRRRLRDFVDLFL